MPEETPLTHNRMNPVTAGLGRAVRDGRAAVVKTLTPRAGPGGSWASSAEPRHWNLWCRERLAYENGLVQAYAPAGLRGPDLLGVEPGVDGTVRLWLEDVAGRTGGALTLDDLARVAGALGRGQAAYAGRSRPAPWTSVGWLRQYVTSKSVRPGGLDDVAWDHPVAVAAWPGTLRDRLRRLWSDRARLFDRAESFPRTLCHLDVWPSNLVAADGGGGAGGGGADVLLDWSFVGEGGLGEDVANLVIDTFADGLLPAGLLPEAVDRLPAAYLTGLRDGGLRSRPGDPGDPDVVTAAIAVTGAAKYAWLAPLMCARLTARDPAASSYDPDASDAERFARRRPLLELVAEWGEAGR